jgi:hypothetical protein
VSSDGPAARQGQPKSRGTESAALTVDDIRQAEHEINARHARIYETLPHRTKSEAHRREWEDACLAFRAYRHPVFDLMRPDVLEKIRSGADSWRSAAILFLEVDPWFFRSGYMKQRLLRVLKGATLTTQERQRLDAVFLAVVTSRDRREFREYCRVAAKVGSLTLRRGLVASLSTDDERVRARTTEMLRYLDEHGAAQRAPGGEVPE